MRMLDRPFYDRQLVFDFFLKKLVPTKGAEQRRVLLSRFRTVHGEGEYRGVLRLLIWAATFPEGQMDSERRQYKKMADELLSRYFPWVDQVSPPFLNAVSYIDQTELIEGLAAFRTPELDSAISEVFQRCVARNPESISDRMYQVDLAMACAQRLTTDVPKDTLQRFLEKRLSEFNKAVNDPNVDIKPGLSQRIGWIEEAIERSGKGKSKGDRVK